MDKTELRKVGFSVLEEQISDIENAIKRGHLNAAERSLIHYYGQVSMMYQLYLIDSDEVHGEWMDKGLLRYQAALDEWEARHE